MKNKRMLTIVAVLIILAGLGLLIVLKKNSAQPSNTETNETSVVDRSKYVKCVDDGGIASTDVFPRSCVLEGVTYYEANK